jgi:Lysyl oxidase
LRTRRLLAFTPLALSALVALGAGTPAHAQPDLIVDTKTLQNNWVVRDENLPADYCSVIEGEVTPGYHRLIRFTVTAQNVGDTDIHIGNPADHFAANDGLFEFATCHQHFHFRNYAKYELIDPATGRIWKAAKRGFCMLDTDPNPAYLGEAPKSPTYKSCGTYTVAGDQGISHGWSDTYKFYLGGQYFVLDGGDGQPVVPPGQYIIRITANPPFKGDKNNPCRVLDPATGLCHNFAESDYTNNIGEVLVTIPDHPGRSGYGPQAGTSASKNEPAEH